MTALKWVNFNLKNVKFLFLLSICTVFTKRRTDVKTRVSCDWESSPPTSDHMQVIEHALGEIQLSFKHLKVRVLDSDASSKPDWKWSYRGRCYQIIRDYAYKYR